MRRKVRSLGLISAAILAIAAVAAPVAQAGKFDIGVSPAIIKGSHDVLKANSQHIFTLGSVTPAICETASFEGTTQGTSIEEAVVTPTYGAEEDCTVFFQSRVRMHGCKYRFNGAGQPANTFLVDIVGCTPGKQIKIEVPIYGCVYSIPEQSGLSHVVAKTGPDLEGIADITMEMTLTGIAYKREAGVCGGPPEGTDGTLQGSTLVRAHKEAGNIQVNKHGHTYSELLAGNRVSLLTT